MKRFENILWNFFIVWASVGVLVAAFRRTLPPWLAFADALFMTLAAANVLFAMARRDGWPAAACSFAIVCAGSATIETVGALTGWPFGPYTYSDRMGLRVAGVLPFTIPLAWWAVLGSGHYLAALVWRDRPRLLLAVATAVWAAATDWILEPFAWRIKAYWQWDAAAVPLQNYAAWFIVAFLLAAACPWGGRPLAKLDPRPPAVAGFMWLTFLAGRIAHGV